MQVWDLKDLGLQATQRIAAASDPLHLMQEISQNFPLLVEALSRTSVNPALRSAVQKLHRGVPPQAQPYMLINGIMYNLAEFDLYKFMQLIRNEVRFPLYALFGRDAASLVMRCIPNPINK
jgi:UDP-glucose:glycoprotein glucosyltransferase